MLRSRQPVLLVAVACTFATLASVSSADETPVWIGNDTLMVARIGRSNRYAAYSKFSGKWVTHQFPENVTVAPVVGDSHIAFALEGKGVTEIVAVDRQGKWRLQKLPDAVSEQCIPVVAENVAAYRIGDRTYAFSGLTGSWDSVLQTLPAKVAADIAMIVAPDRISIFSAQTGTWAESPVLIATK